MLSDDFSGIQKVLPHRYPFLLLDRVICLDLEHEEGPCVTALKNVTANENFFNGHFPGNPVMPGVLTLEALAQASGYMWVKMQGETWTENKAFYLASADNVRYKRMVTPGDQLILKARHISNRRGFWKAECQALVIDELVCSADITCVLKQQETL